MITKTKNNYLAPGLCAICTETEVLLCESNVGGSNEEYTYEDWNQYTQQD